MPVLEILVLALASMVWPALIGVVVVCLASPRPVPLLSWFLAGSLLTTVTIGAAIVFLLSGSTLVTRSKHTFDAAVYLVAAAAALLVAYTVRRHDRPEPASSRSEDDRPGWSERTLSRGSPLAFVVGIVLNVIPGVLPFVALKDIAELDYATGPTLALVVGFYLIMFLPTEIPLAAYAFAPARTTAAVQRFNRWLRGHTRSIAVYVLTAAGIYLAVRGLLAL